MLPRKVEIYFTGRRLVRVTDINLILIKCLKCEKEHWLTWEHDFKSVYGIPRWCDQINTRNSGRPSRYRWYTLLVQYRISFLCYNIVTAEFATTGFHRITKYSKTLSETKTASRRPMSLTFVEADMLTAAHSAGTTSSLEIINIPTRILYTYEPAVYIYIFFNMRTGTLAKEKATGLGLRL